MKHSDTRNLVFKIDNLSLLLVFLGLPFGIVAAAMEKNSTPQVILLILVAVCAVVGVVCAFLPQWVTSRRPKT